jgi:hypothetical protein
LPRAAPRRPKVARVTRSSAAVRLAAPRKRSMARAHVLAALGLGGAVLPGWVTGLSGRYQTLHRELERSQPELVESEETEGMFAHVPTLERPALLRAVLKRNPTIRSAQQAQRAALAWRMRR